ncbi:MAG: NeuD/PglB/VioB family sugar acetyltransferase [Solirubrobacteraceae bacterium]
MSAGARPLLLVLGSYVFAEEVADLAQQSDEHALAGFVENLDRSRCETDLLGLPVHWIDDIPPISSGHVVVCGIGTTRRSAFVEQAHAAGLGFTTVRHPSAAVSPTTVLDIGCIVSAGVIVGAGTRVGKHVILNRGVLVGHHTTIGSYVTISPGANVAGCVTIGDGAYIGIGAIVLDRVRVGDGAVVGAGAVVTRDVAPRTQVLGVPARVVREDVDGR